MVLAYPAFLVWVEAKMLLVMRPFSLHELVDSVLKQIQRPESVMLWDSERQGVIQYCRFQLRFSAVAL